MPRVVDIYSDEYREMEKRVKVYGCARAPDGIKRKTQREEMLFWAAMYYVEHDNNEIQRDRLRAALDLLDGATPSALMTMIGLPSDLCEKLLKQFRRVD